MRKYLLFSVLIPVFLTAQIRDDFSDGDFILDPAWQGNLSFFKISNSSAVPAEMRPALQLDAPAAGISSMSVSCPFSGDLEWQFWVKLSMNTSAGNYSRVYLLSDTADLKAPLHGYFLQIGGSEDSVLFIRQDSLEFTRLFCLDSLYTGNSTNALRFRVTRSAEGTWEFFADAAGGYSPGPRGETTDTVFPGGKYFGIFCQYTSSNINKFYFDDFYAGPLIVDSIPPHLENISVASPSEIVLTFSEAISPETAGDTSNFLLNPDLGHPSTAVQLTDPSMIILSFIGEMSTGANYTLDITGIKDLSGNESWLMSVPVWFYIVKPYDLIITEIMADPVPSAGLPEYEYLEIFNRSPYELDLGGWTLSVSATDQRFPPFKLGAGKYALLCDDDASEILSHLCQTIAFSSFVLPNSGASVQITDTSEKIICYLDYSLSWYDNDFKKDGGWSLEMINAANPCLDEANWAASVTEMGGTPGERNSVSADQTAALEILKTCCISDREIEVEFNQSLDSLAATDISRYEAEPWAGNPVSATAIPPGFRTVSLVYDEGFSQGQEYRLTVNSGLQNCTGEVQDDLPETAFALDEPAEPFDIIINEILFNPSGDGVDYVELYNRSRKAIDLENLVLSSVSKSAVEPPDTQAVQVSSSCRVILPGKYLVLTKDPQKVCDQYPSNDSRSFLTLPAFPSYNNDKGFVLLTDLDKLTIDGFHYSEDMHFLMLNSPEGVSLERICPDRPGDDPSNWHSAAETVGFGTPGLENSQFLAVTGDGSSFSVQPEVFSPDSDGIDDQLGIVYDFSSPGKLITVLIFNSEGRIVKTLANNEMPGTSGIYSWDGTMDDRTPAQNGIYIIYMEALGMDGKTGHYKKAAVLARNR